MPSSAEANAALTRALDKYREDFAALREQLKDEKAKTADTVAGLNWDFESQGEHLATWTANCYKARAERDAFKGRLEALEADLAQMQLAAGADMFTPGRGGAPRRHPEGREAEEDSEEAEAAATISKFALAVSHSALWGTKPVSAEGLRKWRGRQAKVIADSLEEVVQMPDHLVSYSPATRGQRLDAQQERIDEMLVSYACTGERGGTARALAAGLIEHDPGAVVSAIKTAAKAEGGRLDPQLAKLEAALAPRVFDKLEDCWTPARCLAILGLAGMSWATYSKVSNMLVKEWDAKLEMWRVIEAYPGASLPRLAPKGPMQELQEDIRQRMGLAAIPEVDKEGAVLDITAVITSAAMDLRISLKLPPDADIVCDIIISGDGHIMFSGTSVTRIALGIRLADALGTFSNSPSAISTFLLIEGPDKHSNYAAALAPQMQTLRRLLKDGIPAVTAADFETEESAAPPAGRRRRCAHAATRHANLCGPIHGSLSFRHPTSMFAGDIPWLCSGCGQGGCAHKEGCHGCMVPRDRWEHCDAAEVHSQLRTWQGQVRRAHRSPREPFEPFDCDACGAKFATEADLAADRGPEFGKEGAAAARARKKYQDEHDNVLWGHVPVAPCWDRTSDEVITILSRVPPEVLHCILREVARCFWATLREACVTDAKTELLNREMHGLGINMERKLKTRKGKKLFDDEAPIGFIGDACDIIMKDALAGEDSRLFNAVVLDEVRHDVERLWNALIALCKLMVDRKMVDTPENRRERADEMRTAAREYYTVYMNMVGVGGSKSFPVYLHIIKDHLADAVLQFGPDLCQYSSQGLEHLNKIGKACGKLTSRKRRGALGPRGREDTGFTVQAVSREMMGREAARAVGFPTQYRAKRARGDSGRAIITTNDL
jgi:hypothetical protein